MVTGKAVTILGLTTGNEATESLPDSEVVQYTLEIITKIIAKFCKTDVRKNSKNFRRLG